MGDWFDKRVFVIWTVVMLVLYASSMKIPSPVPLVAVLNNTVSYIYQISYCANQILDTV